MQAQQQIRFQQQQQAFNNLTFNPFLTSRNFTFNPFLGTNQFGAFSPFLNTGFTSPFAFPSTGFSPGGF